MKKEYFMEKVSQFIDRKTLEEEFEKYIIRAETMDLSASPLPTGFKLIVEADGYSASRDHGQGSLCPSLCIRVILNVPSYKKRRP